MFLERLIFAKHLEEEETIFFVVHPHWITIFRSTLEVGLLGLALPWGLYFLILHTLAFFWIALVWSALAYCRYFFILIDWYSDAWLVTSSNVIALQFKGVFHNQSSRIEYKDIEGVSYEVNGFLATLLGYGDITLKVMSGGTFTIKDVGNPKKLELEILHVQGRILEAKSLRDSEGIKEILSSMVAHHMRKKLK